MSKGILTFNAGSSTVKFALYRIDTEELQLLAAGLIDNHPSPPHITIHDGDGGTVLDRPSDQHDPADQFAWILSWAADSFSDLQLVAAGHRVVHGGSHFTKPVKISAAVMQQLEALAPLAPLHQPHNLAAIDAVAKASPDLIQVACFDTAFHSSNSSLATAFALPKSLEAEGVRRYGFHGLSYEYIAGILPDHAGERSQQRVIVAHLGSGASLCALKQGRSVATTMGFTALDGLPMAERCGDLDPGVLLYLIKEHGMNYDQLSQLLYHQSGLLGVSGISGDMRVLLEDPSTSAKHAVDLFVYRTAREIGSLAAALGGLDVLVFTAGIGENAPAVRAAICEQASWLGLGINAEANDRNAITLHCASSKVDVYTIPTDENRVIAQATKALSPGV